MGHKSCIPKQASSLPQLPIAEISDLPTESFPMVFASLTTLPMVPSFQCTWTQLPLSSSFQLPFLDITSCLPNSELQQDHLFVYFLNHCSDIGLPSCFAFSNKVQEDRTSPWPWAQFIPYQACRICRKNIFKVLCLLSLGSKLRHSQVIITLDLQCTWVYFL